MAEMTTMVISISCLQKEHAAQFAHDNKTSLSKLVREALAAATEYDLEGENKNRKETRGRPRKYETEEERKEAARERTRERDELTRRLLLDHQRQERQRDAEALQRSLERRRLAQKQVEGRGLL
jgi:hypothetical protein